MCFLSPGLLLEGGMHPANRSFTSLPCAFFRSFEYWLIHFPIDETPFGPGPVMMPHPHLTAWAFLHRFKINDVTVDRE